MGPETLIRTAYQEEGEIRGGDRKIRSESVFGAVKEKGSE